MRCRICHTTHRNTNRSRVWEDQICRYCSIIIEHFSWNGNRLLEYWEGTA